MKIVVDAFGGDYSPEEIIKGSIDAINESTGFTLVMVGKKEIICQNLAKYNFDKSRVIVVNAEEVIFNEESPTQALRTKSDSSIVVGLNYLNKEEDAQAFVSAGSTGAVLTGAVLMLKRIKGIKRPALAPVLPTIDGKQVILIDCGANADPKPEYFCDFALMGASYMKAVYNINSPKIALLSNGAEDNKGNELNKQAFPLLKAMDLNFTGNIEARDMLSGKADVVVCDGFSGNVAMKSAEGTAIGMFSLIKEGILKGGLRAKLGYILLKPALKGIKTKMDYNENGGATLLGLEKVVVKSHGSSKAKSIRASIIQAKHLVDNKVIENIKVGLNT